MFSTISRSKASIGARFISNTLLPLPKVEIRDVLRDGAQPFKFTLSNSERLELYNLSAAAGVKAIETASTGNLPQMKGSLEFHNSLNPYDGIEKHVLFLMPRHLDEALRNGFRGGVCTVMSILEQLSWDNQRCSVEDGFKRAKEIARIAHMNGLKTSAYLSGVAGFPVGGGFKSEIILPCDVRNMMFRLITIEGVEEVVPSWTYGVPEHGVGQLLDEIPNVLKSKVRVHFHNSCGDDVTYKAWRDSLDAGVFKADGTVLGIGGCPNACTADGKPIKKGNADIRKLVEIAHEKGYETGLDLNKWAAVEGFWRSIINKNQHLER